MPAAYYEVARALEQIAPLHLAEEWDNVGLLVDPSRSKPIRSVLLTIDLTGAVLDEAIRVKANMIVAYHPPIFHPIKSLVASLNPAARALERGIVVYSPHTALDAAVGGVNDWLADAFDGLERQPLLPTLHSPAGETHKVVVFVPTTHVDRVRKALGAIPLVGGIGAYRHCSFGAVGRGTFLGDKTTHPAIGKPGRLESVEEVRLEMVCAGFRSIQGRIARAIRESHPYEEPAWEVHKLEPRPSAAQGQGRSFLLKQPITIDRAAGLLKKHLRLKQVRIAAVGTRRTTVRSVGVCAGAGGSVLKNCQTDLLVTGEMRHHDILDAHTRGASVILCDHTNTERGYLPILKKKLHEKLGKSVRIDISKADREPLQIV